MRETNGKQNVWIEQKSRRNEQKIVAQLYSEFLYKCFIFPRAATLRRIIIM